MSKTYYLIFFLLLSFQFSFGQNPHLNGPLHITNFNTDDFNSTVQIWGGKQLSGGSFIFGNDRKIMHFNGEDWIHVHSKQKKDSIQKDKKVFSFYTAHDSTVYVGRNNTFGKLVYDSLGRLLFQPLIDDSLYSTIWTIYETADQNIAFTIPNGIVIYDPQKETHKVHTFSLIENKTTIESSVQIKNGVLFTTKRLNQSGSTDEKPLYYFSFNDFTFKKVNGGINVRSSYQFNSKWYVVDYAGQVYQFNTTTKQLKQAFLLHINKEEIHINQLKYNDKYLWVATEKYGVAVFTLQGELVRTIGVEEGLQDSNVFKLFFDKNNNLWLCLDNGISVINLHNPTFLWSGEQGLKGSIEAFISFKDSIFIAASRSGIYKSENKNGKLFFSNTQSIDQATYDIKRFKSSLGERIVVVGYNGIYDITDLNSPPIVMSLGIYGWELQASPFQKNELFLGGENFIGKFTYKGEGKWDYKKIKETKGDVIKFIPFQNQLFYSVKGSGIFTIDKNNKTSPIPIANNIDIKKSHFYLVKHQKTVYAGYLKGLLKLSKKGVFQKVNIPDLETSKKNLNFHRLYSHPSRDELFAVVFNETENNQEKFIGYLTSTPNSNDYDWHPIHLSSLSNGIIYDIKSNKNYVYFGMNTGFASLNRAYYKETKQKWQVYISKVIINGQTARYRVSKAAPLNPIQHGKSIRLDVRNNQYFNAEKMQYRFRLKGVSKQWSTFEENSYKIYDQLPAGTYTVEFQGINGYSTKSKISHYTFTILAPWYLTWWAYILYGIAFILISYTITRISIYRIKQKNKTLEDTVNERTKEIAEKNDALETQKDEITEINTDLLSSINYAKRIQNTILPSRHNLNNLFRDYFILYLPKDIVSGDFYWAQKFEDKIIWAAIDCTGHGVPGAFVSIVGNNALVRATKEFTLREPAQILNKQRELVIDAFENEGHHDVKDGMDLALVSLDTTHLTLDYAGANNPLIIVRNKEIIEIKADKQPIGEFTRMVPFKNHTLQLEKGDCIYLYSDGFIDQFGGEKDKKFKSKPFKKLLCKIAHLPMKEQNEILQKTLNDWQGENNQIDDICVFGVRV